MATFEINGSTYELPDSLTGDALTSTLQKLSGMAPSSQPQADPVRSKIQNYLAETDKILGLPQGFSAAQIDQESKFNPSAVSKVGAQGLAQVMPATKAALEKRFGRTFDAFNIDDSLFMHREVMRENLVKFRTPDAALAAYNGGWNQNNWNNPETQNYVKNILSKVGLAEPPATIPQGSPAGQPQSAYKPFAKVRQNIDPATLNDDYDWIMASKQVYRFVNNKEWEGTTSELAEWGKDRLGYFNSNIPAMAWQAGQVAKYGSQEDKEAFLYMMETYDNTEFSVEGFKRWAKGVATDPTTYVGIGSLGAGKWIAGTAAKMEAKNLLMQALGRTGVVAGIEGGIIGATDNTIRQGVRIDAGAQEQFSGMELGAATGVGTLLGAGLGTAADVVASKISGLVRGSGKTTSTNAPEPTISPDPIVTPQETPNVAPRASEVAPQALEGTEPTVRATDSPNTAVATHNTAPEIRTEDIPLGSTLSPEEIAQVTAREQPSRRAEDDIIPRFPEDQAVPRIEVEQVNTGLRTTVQNMEELTEKAGKVSDQLRGLNNNDLSRVLEEFRQGRVNGQQVSTETDRILARSVQMLADEIRIQKAELLKKFNENPNRADAPEILQKLADLDERLTPIDLADEAFGSMAGSILRQRQEGLPGIQGLSVEKIMAEQNLPRAEAEMAYIRTVEDAQKTAEAQKISSEYDRQFDEAVAQGDLQTAVKVAALKHRHLESLADARAKGSGSFMQKLTELAISNVFTVKTVMVNLIPSTLKTLITPAIKLMIKNPLVKANRIEASATYGAMSSTFKGALRASLAAYKYEQSLLTRDGSRLLEGELAISGRKGGIIRFFPRILNATDEFLAQLNYSGFIAGREAGVAAAEAGEKGLTGKALNDFVTERVQKALDASLKPAQSEELIRPIINKGVNLGYTGEKLAAYVEREAAKNPEALRHGNDEEALDYARDVLYKRRFSGDGDASKAAQAYERMTNAIPSMRFVLGQLFFRTPIRVFEEGVRMTPGLQILAPKFLSDLAGKNGQLRQIRAQGEAMTSLALTGAVMTLYASGRITGDGAYDDWKQQRARGDTAKQPPYTIKLSDGSYWSYRNLDPIATPLKIIVNGFERLDKLNIRQAQGEYINASEWKNAMSYVTVGTSAIAQAFRDANLVAGLDTTIRFAENLADPEDSEGALVKLFGEKLALLVPNTLHKIAKENDPRMTDPKTFWQVVEEKLKSVGFDKEDIKSSLSYDATGNVRSITDPDAMWSMFSVSDVMELAKGRSEKQLYVLQELDRLSSETGAIFTPPYKMKDTGDLDYRTLMTQDGTQTLYDKWMDKYRSLKPEEALAPLLAAPIPEGTHKYKGEKVEQARAIMRDYYEAAYYQMLSEEQVVLDRMISETLRKARAEAGQFDFRRPQ